MSAHILDRPVWNALVTRQAAFAVGGEHARRFAADVGPLAGARDDSAAALAALGDLVTASLLLLQADPIALPRGVIATTTAEGVQMICEKLPLAPPTEGMVRLGEVDFPQMQALAMLTKPGPFAARTAILGEFWGVVRDGRLVSMAGERLKLDGFSEVSGVCTHPDYRGRGFAGFLSALVTTRIAARGETPFLHAYASNTAAIQLYETLGFRIRTQMHVAVIEAG